MGSIRPLVTITILVVVGAYLYVKINEGPVPSRATANNSANQGPDGVPPLATTKGASLAADSTAPAWPPAANSNAPQPVASAPTATTNPTSVSTANDAPATTAAKDSSLAVPPIPELPPLPTSVDTTVPAAQPSVTPPKDLPLNAAGNRYADEPAQASAASSPKDALPQAATSVTSTAPPLTVPSPPAATTNSAPQQPAPTGLGLNPPTTNSQTSAENPLRATSPPTAAAVADSTDRYGASSPATAAQPDAVAVVPNPLTASADESFSACWSAVQTALERGDLKQAHQLLSKWHANETLSPTDTQKVETLLSQLAGTVIYSTEHRLEPARTVKPGESLDTIAKEYNVPPQLLAKINGIQPPAQLRTGQELKVVRGPFSAVVDLRRNEVALSVDERYAGTFRVSVPPGTNVADGQWVVDQKLAGPPNTANPNVYATTPVPTDRTIILRNATANATAAAPTLIIASGSTPSGQAANTPSLRVSPQDAEELSDILSIGSRVVVRK